MRWLSVIVLCYGLNAVYGCHWLRNVNVSAKENTSNKSHSFIISGCIEDVLFPNQKVEQLYIRGQDNVESLGKNTIKNMKNLEFLSFWGCPIRSITPDLVYKAPKLKAFQISYSKINEIPRGAFNKLPALEMLRIHNNRIDIIEDLSFANLRHLQRIHAGSNRLENWNREWFTNTTNLKVLDFQFNRIRTIPRRAFEKLTKLSEIYFDYNAISIIHPGAFKGIRKLTYLGLRDNRLKEIKGDIFPNNLKIRTLLLDANYLNFLSNEVLQKVSAKDITLDNNPWKCPCLDRIKYWVHQNNGTIRETKDCFSGRIPVCAYATEFSQTCLEYVDQKVTEIYNKALQDLNPPLPEYCHVQKWLSDEEI
ncbi:hypothetical protein GWI33_010495 [Rhynchophorus ferrugineus]|uniref:Uncharacterized protein n=1 Tax=Rhynchophorus ferrugineus TaxID=354439 RepID=A0A834MKE1_RHYFE|nr:hypothetical protein GWI33_010495 [Rhynchophorus ferrugineus]